MIPRAAVAQSDTFYDAAPDMLYRGTITHTDDTGVSPITNSRVEDIWQNRYSSNNGTPFIFNLSKSVTSETRNVFGGVTEQVTVKTYAKAPKSDSFGFGRVSWGVTRFVDSARVSGTPSVVNSAGNGNPSAQVGAGFPRMFSSETDSEGNLTIRTKDGTTKDAVGSNGASFFGHNLSFATLGRTYFPEYPGVPYVEILASAPGHVGQSPYSTIQFAVQSLPNRQEILEIGSGSASISTRSLYIADYEMVRINSAKMIDKETLQIKFNTNYFTWENPAKTILVSGTINGRAVSKSLIITNESIENIIDLNLRELNVPRFDKNQKFKIRLSFGDNSNVFDERTVIIPLPVVLVSGIQPFGTEDGDGVFIGLTDYLSEVSKEEFITKNYLGTEYSIDGVYKTIFYNKYRVNIDSLAEGANQLDVTYGSIIDKTYAKKFYLIGHSKGGLVSRWYIQSRYQLFTPNDFPVKVFVAAQSPHAGAVVSAWQLFGGALLKGYNYLNISSDYPSIKKLNQNKWSYQSTAFLNRDLAALNNNQDTIALIRTTETSFAPLPEYPSIDTIFLRSCFGGYTILGLPVSFETNWGSSASNEFNTVILRKHNTAGDDIVPYFSQSGKLFNPNLSNNPDNPDNLPWLRSLRTAGNAGKIKFYDIPGSHIAKFLDVTDVKQVIFNIIFKEYIP
jgi:hypothetical protein